MYLKKVTLKNVRSFHGRRRVDLNLTRPDGTYAGWTVLAGRNGSGKTTLLRAMALAASGPDVARSLVPGFDTWVSSGANGATVNVTLDFDRALDKFVADDTEIPNAPFDAGLSWMFPTGRHEDSPPRMGELHTGFALEDVHRHRGPWSDGMPGWFCAGYGPFRRLVGGSSDVQRLMGVEGPVSRLASLFHEDASLAEGVGWLIQQHLRALEKRKGAQELKDAALAILGDDLLPDGYRIETVDSEGLWVRHAGNRFPLREMSDGYRTVAALVTDLLKQLHAAYRSLDVEWLDGHPRVTYPGIVFIDEVDAHLHVSWQKRIGSWLKTHFPGIQFIVTTHSPYVCQAADPAGLIRLPGPDEPRVVEVVSDDLYKRIIFGSGDDAALSDLFGLDSPYSTQAIEAREELISLEMDVLDGRATESQRARYRALKRELTSSPATRAREIAEQLHTRSDSES